MYLKYFITFICQQLPFLENSSIESPMNSIISLPDPRTLFMGRIVIGDMRTRKLF